MILVELKNIHQILIDHVKDTSYPTTDSTYALSADPATDPTNDPTRDTTKEPTADPTTDPLELQHYHQFMEIVVLVTN